MPDCDLLNPAAQNLTASGGDNCAALSDQNFGRPTTFSNSIDPEVLGGWGVRSGDWGFGASIQQEMLPRVSVEVGYFRRWLVNFNVNDNRRVTAAQLRSRSASPRRAIRGCPTAAATCCRISTT